ncbi:response regulator, partial [Candidatus Parcubacteria bacterium]|nr:response regulator [Candidatus Parcubacteria bacterium]
PVIVISNLGQEEEIERAFKLGAKDFLIKAHFTLSQIEEKIKEFFQQKESKS